MKSSNCVLHFILVTLISTWFVFIFSPFILLINMANDMFVNIKLTVIVKTICFFFLLKIVGICYNYTNQTESQEQTAFPEHYLNS